MKNLLLSTILVTATAGFAVAQTATTPPATDSDTQAPLTGENMTPTDDMDNATSTPTTPPATTGEAPATGAAAPATDPATDPAVTPADPNAAETAATPSREGYSPMMAEQVTSDNLTGANVYSSEDEDVGSVSELVMDPQGKVTQVIVDIGGFLGIGAKPVALTLEELELMKADDGEEIRAFAPMTREELEALPEYEG